jgi:hypothetical protein
MKGVLFIHLRRLLESEYPNLNWNDILYECGITQLFASGWDYPDRSMDAIMKTAATKLHVSPGELYYRFGKSSTLEFHKAYQWYFDLYPDVQSLFMGLNEIHRDALTSVPGARPPEFHAEVNESRDVITLRYQSRRHLLAYVRGATESILRIYGVDGRIELLEETSDSGIFRISLG